MFSFFVVVVCVFVCVYVSRSASVIGVYWIFSRSYHDKDRLSVYIHTVIESFILQFL